MTTACFYVLYSVSIDKYYIGHTTEAIEERLRKHNSGHIGFTGRAQDWIVVYVERFATKREAYQRERSVKAWKSRKRLEMLFSGSAHPDL